MIFLRQSLQSWGKEDFESVFRQELEQLPPGTLPLQAGLAYSSTVADEPFRVIMLGSEESPHALWVRTGVFYSGIIAGCNCADDPTPPVLQQEYCELEFEIEKATACATVHMPDVEQISLTRER